MPVYYNEEEEQREADYRVQMTEQARKDRAQAMLHEQELSRIKHVETARAKAAGAKAEQWGRVAIAIVKLPSLVLLGILVPMLILARREVPVFLQEYMSL